MVSQPEPSQALTRRGPSSVASTRTRAAHSTTSTRHRHRHGRSLAGGASFQPQNDFPIFSLSGDVDIVVAAGGRQNRYVLHRLILAQCSGFFEASTSLEWSKNTPPPPAAQLTSASTAELARIGEEDAAPTSDLTVASVGREQRKRWRYELDSGSGPDDVPMLVQKDATATTSLFGGSGPPPVRNKPVPGSNPSFFRSVANLTQTTSDEPRLAPDDEDLLRDYDNLFLIFYNYSPTLSAVDIAVAYTQCKSLLSLADMYDALGVVGPRIEHHLLSFRSRLWKQIAKYPASYCRLGYLARSKIIFSEALVHVVGQWPLGERGLRNSLPTAVLDLIEDKVDELSDLIARIEGKLFRLTLLTARGERVTPANSYLDWLVVSLFRQWLAEHTTPAFPAPPPPSPPPPTRRSSDAGRPGVSIATSTVPPATSTPGAPTGLAAMGAPYRALGAGGATYLAHSECKKFLKLSPEQYTRDNLRRFERRLDELKQAAREVVRPLMRSLLELDGMSAHSAMAYLTCTRIDDRDLPWDE